MLPRRTTLVAVVLALVLGQLLAMRVSSLAAPTVMVTPTSGPPGTQFLIAGRDLPPGEVLIRRVRNTVSDAGARIDDAEITIGADGTFRSTFDSSGALPGNYLVQIASRQAGFGTLLASAPFTVTGTAPPGLPATGVGRAQPLPADGAPEAGVALLLALSVLGYRGRRHDRMA